MAPASRLNPTITVFWQPEKRTISVKFLPLPPSAQIEGSEEPRNPITIVPCTRHLTQYKVSCLLREAPGGMSAFLKEKGICFRCCKTTLHMKRTAVPSVIVHSTAQLSTTQDQHLGLRILNPPLSMVGWRIRNQQQDIAIQCTKVCGGHIPNRFCSKICLVKVYPEGKRNKVIKAYAIIDDQSLRSLVCSDFFDTFGDLSPIYFYSLLGLLRQLVEGLGDTKLNP